MSSLEKLRKTARSFPDAPGIYIWRNSRRTPIYIGRAGSLKKRIASYFNTKDSRIAEMVDGASSLEYETTDTLLEAVILEANLIKKYWPKYNVKDKDDRSFVYLVIPPGDFPKPLVVRGRDLEKYMGNKKAKVFGPYQSYRLLKKALEILRRVFPYSTCQGKKRPCFHYQIGLCPGVCAGTVTKQEYAEYMKNIVLFFKGDKKRLRARLEKENPEAMKALQHVSDVALLSENSALLSKKDFIHEGRIEGYDISHHGGKGAVGAMVVFEDGEKNTNEYRKFTIREADTQDDLAMLQEVLRRRLKHTEWTYPTIIFVDGGLNQARAVNAILKEFHLTIPIVGLSKAGRHSGSAAADDKMVILNAKKVGKELIIGARKLFQQVRDEAHRFAISANRKKRRFKK